MELQLPPEQETPQEHELRFNDSTPLSIEEKTGNTKYTRTRQGEHDSLIRPTQETESNNPKLTEKLPLGSIIEIQGDYYIVVKPLSDVYINKFPTAIYVERINEAKISKHPFIYSSKEGTLPLVPKK